MAIVLKELKECRTALKIIIKKELIIPIRKLHDILEETEKLKQSLQKALIWLKKKKNLTALYIEH